MSINFRLIKRPFIFNGKAAKVPKPSTWCTASFSMRPSPFLLPLTWSYRQVISENTFKNKRLIETEINKGFVYH